MLSNLELDFGSINKAMIAKTIVVGGFVHSVRDHGGLIFVDLRSDTKLVQCVFDPAHNKEAFELAQTLHSEYVIKVTGNVIDRTPELVNKNIESGEVEIVADSIEIVAAAKTLPFDIHAESGNLAGEETRLKYRYLDLRRAKLNAMFKMKHKLFLATRNWFDAENFVEVQTPILANSSPEGARDYLIPSRLHPGKFYALPQAPQQFKQLLMVGGFAKYFQIAPCFRDEDPRADRHPGDFYQLDAEIAWADQEDIFAMNEKYAKDVFEQFTDLRIPAADKANGFTRIRYDDSMNVYGSDKPDLRFDLEWQDAMPVFVNCGFKVFADLCDPTHHDYQNHRVQAMVIKNGVDKFSRSDLDKIQDIGRANGLPGIAHIQYTQEGAKSPIFKFFGDDTQIAQKQEDIVKYFGIEAGDLVLFLANPNKKIIFKAQNQMRLHIAKHLDKIIEGGFIRHNELKFSWIYDFPFFENEDGKLDFGHNPFGVWAQEEGKSNLQTLLDARDENRLEDLRAVQYDLTLNGYEVLSGGVRNSNAATLIEAFKSVGYTEADVKSKFKHMMEAYEFAAPPHAGFAWGMERIVMILKGEDNIREVIAFPKNGQAMDVMVDSPSEVSPKLLRELGIKLDV